MLPTSTAVERATAAFVRVYLNISASGKHLLIYAVTFNPIWSKPSWARDFCTFIATYKEPLIFALPCIIDVNNIDNQLVAIIAVC